MGVVYLLHFERAVNGKDQHYTGYAEDLDARLEKHRRAPDVNLLRQARAQGIAWVLARHWPDADRQLERELKRRSAKKLCPICTGAAARP